MRVVTFNIQHGRTPSGRVDTALVARVCAAFQADLIGLQEVDVFRPRSRFAHTVRRVAKATGLHHAFGPAIYGYGNALFSRWPLTDIDNVRLPRHGRHEPRAALLARTNGISVAVTHLSVDGAEAREQLGEVVARLRKRPEPRLLLGDLNLRTKVGEPTWPAHAPRIRIDHIALDGAEWEVTGVQVLDQQPVSDHRPLLLSAKSSTISRATSSRY
jgi:endonuclease/exonuclease/phosphatase family metal-dependent hydrolase